MRRLVAALCVGALLVAACGDRDSANDSVAATTTATTTTAAETSTTSEAPTTTRADLVPRRGGSAVIADDQEPRVLNPFVPGGDIYIVSIIGQAHMAGAYEIDALTRELVPELVVDVPTIGNGGVVLNDDGTMTVKWEIRDEAEWSDGVPISGDDFAFTVAYRTETHVCWDTDDGQIPEPFDLGGEIESIGAKTIAIRFAQPGFQHEDLFEWIVPKHAVEGTEYCEDWNDTTWPASGPFVITEWQRGEYLRLERNPHYWKVDPETGIDLPYLDGVEFRFIPEIEELISAFQARRLDAIQPPPFFDWVVSLQALEGADVQVLHGPIWEHLNFQFGPNNRNAGSMNESRSFRQAVAHALDRDLLVEEMYSGMLPGSSDGILDTMIPEASSQPWAVYNHDPERAAALLEAACEELDRDCDANPPTVVFSTTSNGDVRFRLANLLPDMLAKSGIEVELQLEDSQLFFGDTLDNGDWDLALWAWASHPGGSGIVSVFDLFDPDSPAPDGTNYYRWGTTDSVVRGEDAVTTFRDVLAELRTTYDYDEVKRLAGVLELILAEEVVIIPVTSRVTMGVVWADEIAGYQMNPTQAGHTWNIEFWRRVDL